MTPLNSLLLRFKPLALEVGLDYSPKVLARRALYQHYSSIPQHYHANNVWSIAKWTQWSQYQYILCKLSIVSRSSRILMAPLNALAKAQPLTSASGQSSLPPPTANKPATSFFGSLGTSQSQQNAAPTQSQQTSSLFGNTSQPQQAGGLFGSLNQPAGTSQQQQGSSGGLFGTTTQTQPQQSGSLFGSLGQTQNQNQKPQNNLFGGLGNQNANSTSILYVFVRTNTRMLPLRA